MQQQKGPPMHSNGMKLRSPPALAALLFTAACATPIYVSPVEVTRFVTPEDMQLGAGTISVEAAPGTPDTLEFAPFQAAVRNELAQLGYRVVDSGAAQVAQVSVRQTRQEAADQRGPVTVGGGASTGTFGSGVGLGVGINLTPRPADRIGTMLSVQIRRTGGASNLWEGRAGMTVSVNSDYADGGAAAARLAQALFQGFPGQSGETIAVE